MEDKKKVNIHVISSVKGGCGKTAFSIFKAMDLAKESRNKEIDGLDNEVVSKLSPLAHVLWIDADLRGTSSKDLFYGRDAKTFSEFNKGVTFEELIRDHNYSYGEALFGGTERLCFHDHYNPYTLFDYLYGTREDIDGIITHGYLYSPKGSEKKRRKRDDLTYLVGSPAGIIYAGIDMVFSSPLEDEKNKYTLGGNLPTIDVGRFATKMESLLNWGIRHGDISTRGTKADFDNINSGGIREDKFAYSDIVVDMPPGEDIYAESLMGTIRKMAENHSDEVCLSIYVVTTSDRGHRNAMCGRIERLYREGRSNGYEENLYTVLNEIRNKEFATEIVNATKHDVDGMGVEVIKNFYNTEYFKFCQSDSNVKAGFSYKFR